MKTIRFATVICLVLLCVLLTAGCTDHQHKPTYTPGTTAAKTQTLETIPVPDNFVRHTAENFAIGVPDSFVPFTSGDPKNLVALTDENAQVYIRKCVPADTGTDAAYFEKLDAAEYCELYCDLKGLGDTEPLPTYRRSIVGVRYTVPADSDETTAVFSLYFMRDADHRCVWMVKCRCTLADLDTYEDMFETLTGFFSMNAD